MIKVDSHCTASVLEKEVINQCYSRDELSKRTNGVLITSPAAEATVAIAAATMRVKTDCMVRVVEERIAASVKRCE